MAVEEKTPMTVSVDAVLLFLIYVMNTANATEKSTSDKSGEIPKAFVVRKDPSLTEKELLDYAKTALTGYKRPRQVAFVDELPKSNVGKILRKELRKLEANQ